MYTVGIRPIEDIDVVKVVLYIESGEVYKYNLLGPPYAPRAVSVGLVPLPRIALAAKSARYAFENEQPLAAEAFHESNLTVRWRICVPIGSVL